MKQREGERTTRQGSTEAEERDEIEKRRNSPEESLRHGPHERLIVDLPIISQNLPTLRVPRVLLLELLVRVLGI